MQAFVGLLALLIVAVAAKPQDPQQWGQQAMDAGAVLIAEGADRIRDGVAMKEKYSRKFDVFGVPIGGEIGYKIGAGDSLNRDKRQVEKPVEVETEIADGQLNPGDEQVENRAEEGKKWYRKFRESCEKLLRRIGEFFNATNE
ncbi:uncharacterized protein LOC132264066 [Phlebotomus argentipes]|uniref:uncharacterized protein LOC132264066 n=1 Tax=Phlebotomus argentipes TaxID=94469 RepID=UPI0028929873|nr:uncharacterized protein LOC132264066 [Phlebotomus argentipes]